MTASNQLVSKVPDYPVPVGEREFSLADFLTGCLETTRGAGQGDAELADAHRAFVAAGLAALRAGAEQREWTQVGLAARPDAQTVLPGLIADIAGELLDHGLAVNFFFMHKPPGLRLRFQAAPGRFTELHRRVLGWAEELRARGTAQTVLPAVYEPETQLFGGPVSMRYVHELFTADSLAWLEIHRHAAAAPGPEGGEDAAPPWAMSLLLLRAVLDGLEIVGWEHRDVWRRVQWETGRQFPTEARAVAGLASAAEGIRRMWERPDALLRRLPRWAQRVAERHRAAALDVGHRWRAEYFHTEHADVGPRRAAAFYVVFHWNRGRLTAARQSLLAEALASPGQEPAEVGEVGDGVG
ncbi:thiopeptide-type bacteriocin biosynthesis protein [Streptoalloteichus hindustanus]|uniref:Thiopeptide-type bacteriocin biosynthesis domain-containing protein n=1 Tax=Streptoalloteichus hindustanus TaxID=2017 RepID=A0A1M5JTH6_STRHI|nr:thiopeptide-type bacteriocin biosynthesis protein [Streptoalloteichus hindustanus]SHG43715.1 thiopeptide-type bacteriocin biosynthesis domain-containing protein [Streptoalloteichus hindustanus]